MEAVSEHSLTYESGLDVGKGPSPPDPRSGPEEAAMRKFSVRPTLTVAQWCYAPDGKWCGYYAPLAEAA